MKIASLKPAYIKKVEDHGDIQVWIVDGTYIRCHIDEEFTSFGQHYRFPFIPVNEFWIDREAGRGEVDFYVDHMLVEHRLMAQGMPYEKALVKGDLVERKERRRTGDIKRLTHNGKKLPEGKDCHSRLWKKLENGITVWIVDGCCVRDVFNVEFTEGGHDYVYEFVPINEVWIDNDLVEAERGYVLLHEIHERNLMAKGWSYNKAHADSSRLEYHCRHHPDELHAKLAREGWA